MKKRLLSLFMVFSILLGMLPIEILAAEIPVGAPFTAVTADVDGEVTVKQLANAAGGGLDLNGYSPMPHYHITVPAGTTYVTVTYPSVLDAYTMSATKEDNDVIIAWSSTATVNDAEIIIPVADYLAVICSDGWVSGSGVMPQAGWWPINMLTFEYAASAKPESPEAGALTIEDTHCTIEPAVEYAQGDKVTYYSGSEWDTTEKGPMPRYVVELPAGTETVKLTFGNSIGLTPDYYDYTQFNFYYGTLTYTDEVPGVYTEGYVGRTQQIDYTAVSETVSSIELNAAKLIAGGKMIYTIDSNWNPLYAIEFVYAAGGSHECSWNAGQVTKAATCRETGVMTYTCTVKDCGETRTESIPLADHNWNGGTVDPQPTCQTAGTKTYKCLTSGCTETKTEPVAPSESYHSWNGGAVTKTATCKEAGETTFTCTVENCGDTKIEPIAKLTTHTYGEDGKAKFCSVCEAENPDYVDESMPQQVDGVYQISTADQLLAFADFVNKGNGNVKAALTADIDLSGKTWTPMKNFGGTFDGQNHTITFKNASNGLFESAYGVFKNNNYSPYAEIRNVVIEGSISGSTKVGAIAGTAYGVKITGCISRATVTGSGNYVGGLVGFADKQSGGKSYAYVLMEQCGNEGRVSGKQYVGGLFGYTMGGSSINLSYNIADVSGTSSSVGGLVGYMKAYSAALSVKNSYNLGKVSGSADVGGLIGRIDKNASNTIPVENCYTADTSGKIVGTDMNTGGKTAISNSYALGSSGAVNTKTDEEMQSAAFVTTLGEYFRKSSSYPILSWQAAGSATEYAVTKPETAGVIVTAADMAYDNEDYTFTVQIENRYRTTDDFAILVNGGEVEVTCELSGGVYTCTVAKEAITSDLAITVIGVEATKTVLYSGTGRPESWVYVSEIAIDDVEVKSVRAEGDTIYVVLEEDTTVDGEVYFTVARDGTNSSALHMLNITPGQAFTRRLSGGSLTEVITAGVSGNTPVSWTIVVTIDGITTYTVTLPTGTGYTVSGANAAVGGQPYTFTVTLDKGYMEGETFAVKANGTALTPNADGSYTVPNVESDLTITVEGVVEKPFEDPFSAIKAGDRTLSAEEILLKTKDFHLGGKGQAFDYRVYENVPYYQIVVDKVIEWVEVIFKAATDILTDTVARGYTTDIDGIDAVSSPTIRGTSFEFTENADGTKTVKIPVIGYTVNSKGGKAIGPEMEGQSNQPVALFSFLFRNKVSTSDNAAFTVLPEEGYTTTVLSGDDFKFTVRVNRGYCKTDDFAVKVGDAVLTPDETGVYTIANITDDVTIEVTGSKQAEKVSAYISVSHDGSFMEGENGVAVLREIEVPWFDLSAYGLEKYAIPAGEEGYQKPTLLHLYIMATETIYCGLDAEEAGKGYLYEQGLMPTLLNADLGQDPGSMYMKNFWGYDENLRYYYNYEYPYYPGTTTGATSDRLLLQAGDVATVGHFSDWKAHENSANGFNYLVADASDVVTSTIEQGETLTLTVRRSGGGMGGGSYDVVLDANVDIYYTMADNVTTGNVTAWTRLGTAEKGVLTMAVDLQPGEYILAVAGQKGAATQAVCSAPGAILLTVEEKALTDADRDAAAAKAVYDRIEALPATVTLEAEEQIAAARAAYEDLTSAQQALVFNLGKLTAAEAALQGLKDGVSAGAVDAAIEAIGEVTLEDEAAIRAARKAYNLLTAEQKALVAKLDVLTAAEAELDALKREANAFADLYAETKAYLASLAAPTVGTTNGEWRVLGLVRAGGTVADSYYENVVAHVRANMDANGRLHASKSTENARIILALTAMGRDVTDVGGYDLLSGLDDMAYIGNQGLNGTIWALIAFDSNDYAIPNGDVSREALVEAILNAQKSDGGWALSGDSYDPDMTGMALQALAPYAETNAQVKAAVDRALQCLSEKQQADGTWISGEGKTVESLAQVITGLTALGIDPETDSRFVKNGISAVDAMSAFYLGSGRFEHGIGTGANTMATEQAFYAMVAYDRFKNGQSALYDMRDVFVTKYAITITESENGTITSSAVQAAEGTTVTLTVRPAIGYALKTLTVGGTEQTVGEDGSCTFTFTMPAADVVVTAEFEKIDDPAKAVADAIAALTVTKADKASMAQIEAIEAAYAALTTEQKLTVENYVDLVTKIGLFDSLLAEAKAEAKVELIEYVSELRQDSYSKENWLKIQRLYSAALSDLSDGRYTEAIDSILSAVKRDINKVPKGGELTVTFRLIGDGLHEDGVAGHEEYVTWIPTTTYKMPAGSTMYDVFMEAMEEFGLKQRGAANGYVESVTAPDCLGGYWLGEFDNGPNSGWMYTVNGDHPNVGLEAYELEDGDIIIWHYVDDYIKEERSSSSAYYYRWLEARDISPETYVRNKLGKILSVGKHGSVKPDTLKLSDIGETITFTFKPDTGYKVKNVTVDGVSKGSITSYTYKNLRYDSRISVEFAKKDAITFTDVAEGAWYYEDVRFAIENGLFNGTSEDTFSPDLSMTRAMLVTVLYRMEGEPAVSGSTTFGDVQSGQYYTDAVLWAAGNGIVGGYDEDTFGTHDNITREQMAAILYRYAEHKGFDLSGGKALTAYSDYSEISAYALKALKWAGGEGLITGRSATTLAPKGTATRAEVAAILHRFMEGVAE